MFLLILGDKLVLVAVNAKYCHTSLSVRSISGYLKAYGYNIPVAEFTINDRSSRIVRRLYELSEDVYAFSCYIWNIEIVKDVCKELKILRPDAKIWLGGPEVSFDPESYLFADRIFCGEGEKAMLSVLNGSCDDRIVQGANLQNLDELPFLYDDLENVSEKIVYYESSRGCPFNCSYCLSSSMRGVRYRSLERVFEDILAFEKSGAGLVKFVDRTFNADKKRAVAIWDFIKDNCKNTSFHFEIEGELLDSEQIKLLKEMPKGRVQLEIGVQSTNPETLSAVNRKSDIKKLLGIISEISKPGNIHIHADLIAGMPYESYDRFKQSFDELYAAKPHCIQLGFLKLLKGSGIRIECEKWNYKFSPKAPYTVLSNDFISYDEIKKLEDIEYLVDKLHASGCFEASLEAETNRFNSPFAYFEALSVFMNEHGYFDRPISRKTLYRIMYDFHGEDAEFLKILKLDYLDANGRPAPLFMGEDKLFEIHGFEEKYNRVKNLFNKNKR